MSLVRGNKTQLEAASSQGQAKPSPCVYTFFRADGFYPLELRDDQAARDNAATNPGTVEVQNMLTGEVIWLQPIIR